MFALYNGKRVFYHLTIWNARASRENGAGRFQPGAVRPGRKVNKESAFTGTDRKMKKKILVVCLLIALVLVPATAASYKGSTAKNTLGVGLNLGTNTGVGLKFGMGKFDVIGNVGIADFHFGNPTTIAADAAASYEVYDIDIKGQHHMPITVGLGVNADFVIGSESSVSVGILAPVGIEYTIPTFPMNFYLRLAPGLDIKIDGSGVGFGFGFGAYLGALYMFDI